jgi:hypothetical protein
VESTFVISPSAERERFWKTVETLRSARPALRDIRGAKVSFVKPMQRFGARHPKGGEFLRDASLVELLGK